MNNKWVLFVMLAGLLNAFPSIAQTLYIAGNSFGGGYVLGQYNVETCQFCPEFTAPLGPFSGGMTDVVPLPNGNVIALGNNGEVVSFDPPSSVPIASYELPNPINITSGVLAPNGNVYLATVLFSGGNITTSIYEYDPGTNSATLLGSALPNTWLIIDMYFWNGTLYAFAGDNSPQAPNTYALVTIQVGNPLTISPVYYYTGPLCGAPTGVISSGPFAGVYTGTLDPLCTGSDLYLFDIGSNSVSLVCDIYPSGYPYGVGEVPPGFPATPCLCFTNAGTVTTPNTTLCAGQTFNFTSTGGSLEGNDVKQYVLFTNPADTLGSIIAIANSPVFDFDPNTMQLGVTYYAAAMAGNALNGNVDTTDPCLDFSNAVQVVWQALPSVIFSASNTAICPVNCQAITVNFTGTPPFNLTYSTSVTGVQTQVFAGNTGTIQLCPPAGTPLGDLVLSAQSLSDSNCSCD